MIECPNCHKQILFTDSFCKYCGAKQNVEENQNNYYETTFRPHIESHIMPYEKCPWFFLLWKYIDSSYDYANLSAYGNKLLVLELEKYRYQTEMQYATPKAYEKKKHSYELRVERINELVTLLDRMAQTQKYVSKRC